VTFLDAMTPSIILYISASQRAGISMRLGDYEALDGWALYGFERGTLRVGVTGSEPCDLFVPNSAQ
jgi:hypothetical protein